MKRNVRRVLVVENDSLQAEEIRLFLNEAGDRVLGPVGSVEMAMVLVPEAEAAILDVDLNGQPVFALADQLLSRNVPVVFHTGREGQVEMPLRFAGVPMIRKPAPMPADRASGALPNGNGDVCQLLPRLRLIARLFFREPAMADRLVERLLEEAIRSVSEGLELGEGEARLRWLADKMRAILDERGETFMN